jgi:hypothetical protein
MAANEVAKKGTIIQDFTKTETLKHRFLQTKRPTEDEMISVLSSPNRRVQRVGLAAMCLRPIEKTDQLIEIILEFLQDEERDFRYYAYFCFDEFTKFPESKKAELGIQLLEIIKKEKDEGLFIQELSLLAKFPSEEAALFLAEQLMKGGKNKLLFRHFAFKALKKMGDSYYDEAAEYINRHGSPEIKKEFMEHVEAFQLINNKN